MPNSPWKTDARLQLVYIMPLQFAGSGAKTKPRPLDRRPIRMESSTWSAFSIRVPNSVQSSETEALSYAMPRALSLIKEAIDRSVIPNHFGVFVQSGILFDLQGIMACIDKLTLFSHRNTQYGKWDLSTRYSNA